MKLKKNKKAKEDSLPHFFEKQKAILFLIHFLNYSLKNTMLKLCCIMVSTRHFDFNSLFLKNRL